MTESMAESMTRTEWRAGSMGRIQALGRAAITKAAVRRSTGESPGRVFGSFNLLPPTDVMAITSLPRGSHSRETG
jgi:hypothetical protein